MAAPTNTTIATAAAVTLGTPVTQNVHDGGTTYTVWYEFVAPADEVWVGVLALGDLTVYRPLCSVWLGPVGAPTTLLGIQGQNEPLQFTVTTGTSYYFKIEPNAGNPSPAVLTLSVLSGPQYDVPIGSLAVNDDSEGFPLVFLSTTTGAVLAAVPNFPAGEAADILPSGVVAVANAADSQVAVYSAALTLVGAVTHPASGLFGFIRAHAASGVFYVANETNGQIRTVTAAGAFGPTTWTTGASGLQSLAVTNAGTLAYYGEASTELVKQWNLTSNTTAGTFVAYPVAGTEATDILVLSDDTVVINFAKTGETHLRHYSAAGALLHSYDYTGLATPSGTLARLAMASAEPAAVWLWTHHFTPDLTEFGLSKFRKVRLADGVPLVTLDTTEFETGIYQPTPVLDPVRFGHSYSCAFWETRAVVYEGVDGPEVPEEPTEPPEVPPPYSLDVRYMRRLRRAPHVNHEHQRVFFRRFELDLERGQGLATGQGSDPVINLRLSRDGGQTWSEPIVMHAGRLGAYTQRVIARRLGHARDTVFEVTVSDPIAWSLVGAWLDLEPGTS